MKAIVRMNRIGRGERAAGGSPAGRVWTRPFRAALVRRGRASAGRRWRALAWSLAAAAALAVAAPQGAYAAQATSIAVIGDSIARHYCRGITRHLRGDDRFRVSCWVHPSSGLTRDDFLDWEATLGDYLERDRVDVAVVSFGANDAQRMLLPDRVLAFDDDAWAAEYETRVDAMLTKLKEHGARVVWVGLPIPRSDSFARKLARLNAIYEARALANGAAFHPLWEATQDASGRYATALPDAKGRMRVAREEDGVHFTREGEILIACKLMVDIPGATRPDGC
ncbi:SGNH/GDSL hydrolase family protein [Rubrimonas cliftonensis]|uniref:SGNH hydrolase-type esterase domain-containing protein n=1 Tax=Rubrimonas cliftonensis TaxID=89524 RepID=A0A1H3YRI9_9RHOB|nr:DUF459 domain-containing protein [Rubrimonas cliftonensis]SEA13708.1 hypothetical protein SAMN05444370_103201 [Rubrimonas cliftonensis]